ncbi:hypothetical protein WMY93_022403 [Mugilogobius chulae]|uniref:Uncharacterized protein n=1 Tax=Mugilogobius chulae TaxID=88201 RepID=A0AAW0N6W4_9GOBI
MRAQLSPRMLYSTRPLFRVCIRPDLLRTRPGILPRSLCADAGAAQLARTDVQTLEMCEALQQDYTGPQESEALQQDIYCGRRVRLYSRTWTSGECGSTAGLILRLDLRRVRLYSRTYTASGPQESEALQQD